MILTYFEGQEFNKTFTGLAQDTLLTFNQFLGIDPLPLMLDFKMEMRSGGSPGTPHQGDSLTGLYVVPYGNQVDQIMTIFTDIAISMIYDQGVTVSFGHSAENYLAFFDWIYFLARRGSNINPRMKFFFPGKWIRPPPEIRTYSAVDRHS